jgi:hypothetical protein
MHRLVLTSFTSTLAAVAATAVLASPALADSTPVGPLPKGPSSTFSTHRGWFVAVALPRQAKSTGLVWRLARPVKTAILHQVSEADVGKNVVVVFNVSGSGTTSIVFALTKGDSSPKAIRAITTVVRVT